jgi:thioesterase domain-containing protein
VGFSFGGVLAFEVAQQLEAAGESVGLIAIIDSDVPGTARDGLWFRLRRAVRRILHHRRSRGIQAPASALSEEALADSVSERNHGYLAAMRRYHARPYAGKAVFVEASLDGEHTPYGWPALVEQLEVHALPADHLGVLQGEMARRLAAILQQRLG